MARNTGLGPVSHACRERPASDAMWTRSDPTTGKFQGAKRQGSSFRPYPPRRRTLREWWTDWCRAW